MEQLLTTRPVWNDEMTAEIQKEISEILQNWDKQLTSDDAFEIAKEIPYYAFRENGYELAKRLEDDGGITPDAELVEDLDYLNYRHYHILNKHIKNWVKENNLTLTLPIGTIVEFIDTTNNKKVIAEITNHYPEDLNYGVWWEGMNHPKGEACRILASDKIKELTVS